MKNILIKLVTALTLLNAATAEASPHLRFWKGLKKSSITNADFERALNTDFIPETVRVGQQRGLLGYMPVLPKPDPAKTNITLPDELALVIYKSEPHYKAIRATPEGQAYGAHHWDLFDKEAGSQSFVPTPLGGNEIIENGKAYRLLNRDVDWQKSFPVFNANRVTPGQGVWGDPHPEMTYLQAVKKFLSARGLQESVVLFDGGVLYEYQIWSDEQAYVSNMQLIWSTQMSVEPLLERQKTRRGLPDAPAIAPGILLQNQFPAVTTETDSPDTQAIQIMKAFTESRSDQPEDANFCSQGLSGADTERLSCAGQGQVLMFGGHLIRQNFACDIEYARLAENRYLKINEVCQ